MKATIEVPDELYRRVKARAASLGRPVREVTIELYRRWLGDIPPEAHGGSSEEWLAEWLRLGDTLLEQEADAPTATEILAADRARLDPR
jgi:hypothetical protein